MFPSRWLRNVLGVVPSRKTRRRLAAPSRKPVRLMLESLEERLTPSGGQTAGSYNALTAAIAADTAANTNYVIQITNSFTFNSGGQVSISKLGSGSTLTIEGQNGGNFTLTGNRNRLFTVASGQSVTFADLTLTGGGGVNSGGAIQDQGGNVTLSKVIVQGNTVKGGTAEGGGVYAIGAGTLVIRDSILRDNSAQGSQGADGTAPGSNGGNGGSAYGGGLFVGGSGWTVMLTGDTFSGNTAMGGYGGNGAKGSNATIPNTTGGNGGNGGDAGDALGGAAYFSVSGNDGSGRLTILNNRSAPSSNPSIMIDNTAQAGTGGDGGAGGDSTGTAYDSFGGGVGVSGSAEGGAIYLTSATGATLNVNIGNGAFYANTAATGNDGWPGAPGTGGRMRPPPAIAAPLASEPDGPIAAGGGLAFGDGNLTMVNSTVARNTVINTAEPPHEMGGPPPPPDFYQPGPAWGGGIYDHDALTVVLDNNTITQNTLSGGNAHYFPLATGAGVFVASGNPTLANNLIQGNQNSDSSASDLAANSITLSNASHNFIATMSANGVSTTSNIVSNLQVQLGSVVGVDANGKLTGGPIYYPLLPGVVSIGAGTTSVLNTIARVEGTTPANATDEIGNPLSSNGTISLGAVQIPTPPPSSPALSPFQLMLAITLDVDALVFQDFPPILSFLNSISEQFLGQPLPSTADLIPTIQGDFAALVAILIRDR